MLRLLEVVQELGELVLCDAVLEEQALDDLVQEQVQDFLHVCEVQHRTLHQNHRRKAPHHPSSHHHYPSHPLHQTLPRDF